MPMRSWRCSASQSFYSSAAARRSRDRSVLGSAWMAGCCSTEPAASEGRLGEFAERCRRSAFDDDVGRFGKSRQGQHRLGPGEASHCRFGARYYPAPTPRQALIPRSRGRECSATALPIAPNPPTATRNAIYFKFQKAQVDCLSAYTARFSLPINRRHT
jgi:hypothetical protein